MDKKYYLWLQQIANVNDKFNYDIFKRITKEISIEKIYNFLDEEIYENLISLKVDKSIIECFKNNNIKEKCNVIYFNVIALNLNLITIEEYYHKWNIKELEIPFCIITSKGVEIKSKNVYIYYSSYFSKYAKNTMKYFSKIIQNEKCNTISSIEMENVVNLKIQDENFKNFSGCNIILPSEKYCAWFFFCFIDILILIEAKYEEEIVRLVDEFARFGKDVFVVPSNIFSKNSYFSNYLIKQGADVIVNGKDLKFILKSNIR